MSLLEQSLSSMRSEFGDILKTNMTTSTGHYDGNGDFISLLSLIWEDTAYVGITSGDDVQNIVVNPQFVVDSAWDKGDGWSIENDTAECDGSQSTDTTLTQTGIIEAYNLYRIKMDYDITEGKVRVNFDGLIKNQSDYLDADGCDIVLRALSDSDFVITGDSDLKINLSNITINLIDPISSNKFDAVAYCLYNEDINIGDFLVVNSIRYLVFKLEFFNDHKKVYCLHL